MIRPAIIAVASALAASACTDPGVDVEVVGTPPIECAPPPTGGSDDIDPTPPAATSILAPLPVLDPDCTSQALVIRNTAMVLTWTEAGTVRDELAPAELRSTWSRAGDTCRIRIAIALTGGPRGRPAHVRACDVVALSTAWASFQDIAITLARFELDAAALAGNWPVVWADSAGTTACRDAAPVDLPALGLELDLDLVVPIEGWRRLHSTAPPVVVVRAVLETE